MRITTNTENRKQMVNAIAELMGEEAKYSGAPGFAYSVGNVVINRDGTITSEDDENENELRAFLIANGYAEEEEMELKITVPAEDFTGTNIRNLVFMVASRQYLLNKAASSDCFDISDAVIESLKNDPTESKTEVLSEIEAAGGVTGIAFVDDAVTFTFMRSALPEKNKAFTELASRMIEKVKEAKRISPERHTPENEKYYFRIWLVQLGFGGAENKESRNALMKGLTGYAAFRTEEAAEKFKAEMKAKRNSASEGRDA